MDERVLQEAIRFHGHMCAGLALGLRACEVAQRVLGPDLARADLIVAVETDTCSVDAIQVLTGATFGNGQLYFRDHAKNAYMFWRAGRATALRIVARADDSGDGTPRFWEIFEKVQRGTASDQERSEFFAVQQERSQHILEAPEQELFRVQEVTEVPPARPLITPPLVCDRCGEATMAHRARQQAGTVLCVPCGRRPSQLIGAR